MSHHVTHHHLLLEKNLEESHLLHVSSEANALITLARNIPARHILEERLPADALPSVLSDAQSSRYTVSLAESIICLPTHEAVRAFAC